MAVKKYNIRQSYQDLQADLDKIEGMPSVEDVESGLSKANSAYQKPSSGIPASDLDPEAIPSVMPISTDISADGTSDTMAASPKAVKTYVDGHTPDNVLKYTQQTLTEEQKAQARANVDVASLADIAVIEAAIQAIDRGEYITETVRPTASASTMGHIYLIGPDANNNYERYFTKESNGTYSWVSLGSTQIDLSTYAKNEKVSQLEAKLPMLGGYLVPLLRKVVYKDDDAESLINGINALLNTIELTSISAVYTQPGTIYAGQSLDDLKNGLVVTANYNDGTSVEVNDYELSGTLTAGTSSIVVTYQEETTTFNVTVTDAVYYKDGSLLPGRVGLRNSFTSAGQSAAYVKDNVKYVFTNDFAKSGSTTPKKRCAYYLFDILLTAGKNYRHIIEFESSLTSSQFIQISLAYYDETYRVAGVANVDTPQDYSNNVQATSWLSTTKDGSSVYMDDIAPSGYVGGRISLRLVNSSNVEQDWPTTLTVKRYIIQEVE